MFSSGNIYAMFAVLFIPALVLFIDLFIILNVLLHLVYSLEIVETL